MARRGIDVRAAKSGPDYIDPAFHEAASGKPSINLDAWAMHQSMLQSLVPEAQCLLVEGAMGLFDGAPPEGRGSTADLARVLDLPVVLVLDVRSVSHSVAALAMGFAKHDPTVSVAGVILNQVGSLRHEEMLRGALAQVNIPVLGAIPRKEELALPSRHLGLVQAVEYPDLSAHLDRIADIIERHIPLEPLLAYAAPYAYLASPSPPKRVEPERRLALAWDAAFAFVYPHQIQAWAREGWKICPFSPLADEPVPKADRVFLPGGYPELYCLRLSTASTFLATLREAAEHTQIYGECGGYMVLGETLIDAEGVSHPMANLLPLVTSFAERKRHLGYRTLVSHAPWFSGKFTGHEYHYATTVQADGPPLFDAWDAHGAALPPMGLVSTDRGGCVAGSFAHIISQKNDDAALSIGNVWA